MNNSKGNSKVASITLSLSVKTIVNGKPFNFGSSESLNGIETQNKSKDAIPKDAFLTMAKELMNKISMELGQDWESPVIHERLNKFFEEF